MGIKSTSVSTLTVTVINFKLKKKSHIPYSLESENFLETFTPFDDVQG